MRGWTLSDSFCVFKLPDISGKVTKGVFYIDAYRWKLLEGPGPKAIRQFIEPGFNVTVSGDFNALDTFIGVYYTGAHGSFQNIGFGLDSDEN